MHPSPVPPAESRGFTLIELLITVTVVIILAAVAWPSFMEAVRKGRRADAYGVLARVMQAEERYRTNNPSYTADLSAMGAPSRSSDEHYAVSMVAESVTASSYTAQATARSTSPQFDDTRCRVLQVVVVNGNIVYNSINGSNVANAAPDPCWVK